MTRGKSNRKGQNRDGPSRSRARDAAVRPSRSPRDPIAEEIAHHLRERTDRLIARGLTPEEAHREARSTFGNPDRYEDRLRMREKKRNGWRPSGRWTAAVWNECRFLPRSLRRSPLTSLAVIAVMALGLGAGITIFTIADNVLLEPLPFPESDRLVVIQERIEADTESLSRISPAAFGVWRESSTAVFEGLSVLSELGFELMAGSEPTEIHAAAVAPDYFSIFALPLKRGRTFTAGETSADGNQPVVISEALWQRLFGADPAVLGTTIQLSGRDHTVIGVLADSPAWPADFEAWVPIEPYIAELLNGSWGARYLIALARLQPTTTLAGAAEHLTRIMQEHETAGGLAAVLTPLRTYLTGEIRRPLLLLMGAVLLVLLVACANVGNLLLSRSLKRWQETGVRAALGAGRGRLLISQVLEGVALVLAGSLLGLVCVALGIDALFALLPDDLPRGAEIAVDGPVVLFAVVLGIVTGILAGLLPGLRAASTSGLAGLLREGGRGVSKGRAGRRLLNAMVAAEIALTMVLLTGAALLGHSFWRTVSRERGFDPDGVVLVRFQTPEFRYPSLEDRDLFFDRLLERVQTLPGVTAAALSNANLPMGGSTWTSGIAREGEPFDPELPQVQLVGITPGYFRVFGIPIAEGEDLTREALARTDPVIMVNERFAEIFYPGESALGRRARSFFTSDFATITGVAADVLQRSPTRDAPAILYQPITDLSVRFAVLLVRTELPVSSLYRPLADAMHELDPQMPLTWMASMREVVSRAVARPRFYLILMGAFAALTLLLTIVGYYGVVSQNVTGRAHEIGVRIALGADPRQITALVFGQGMRLVAGSIGAGIVLALAATRLLSSLLYGITPLDPLSFAAGVIVLLALSALAMFPTLHRTVRTDPVAVMRDA